MREPGIHSVETMLMFNRLCFKEPEGSCRLFSFYATTPLWAQPPNFSATPIKAKGVSLFFPRFNRDLLCLV